MSNRGFTVRIPYSITVNGKKWDMTTPLKEYLNSPAMRELSDNDYVTIENNNIIWNYLNLSKNELLNKVIIIDPRDVLCHGSIEAKDDAAIFTCKKYDSEYDIDLNTVKFSLPLIDKPIDGLNSPESSDESIQHELNQCNIAFVHIVAGLIYPKR